MNFPMERFMIIFRHDFVDSNGTAFTLDEPLVVSVATQEGTPVSINYILRELTGRIEHEVIQKYGGENDKT